MILEDKDCTTIVSCAQCAEADTRETCYHRKRMDLITCEEIDSEKKKRKSKWNIFFRKKEVKDVTQEYVKQVAICKKLSKDDAPDENNNNILKDYNNIIKDYNNIINSNNSNNNDDNNDNNNRSNTNSKKTKIKFFYESEGSFEWAKSVEKTTRNVSFSNIDNYIDYPISLEEEDEEEQAEPTGEELNARREAEFKKRRKEAANRYKNFGSAIGEKREDRKVSKPTENGSKDAVAGKKPAEFIILK